MTHETLLTLTLFALAFVPMIAEAALSARNARALVAAGAFEPTDDVFAAMQIAYPAGFVAMVFESWWGAHRVTVVVLVGVVVFVAAKGLKYWAIASLGRRWTFRVLVPPSSTQVRTGPYRVMRHPNYVGVIGELAGMGLMAQAPIAGLISLAIFGLLLAARIRIEERALSGARQRTSLP